jgi:large subunit ribosomal protein L25
MRASLQAEQRVYTNRTGLKRLRQEGRIPGVIFGTSTADSANKMIHISANDFMRWTRNVGTGVLDLKVEGGESIPVLVEGIQRDSVTRDYLHIDFLKVAKDELVRTKIAVELVGTAKGIQLGGIVLAQNPMVEVQALPGDLPSVFVVNISDLDMGQSLTLGDLKLPEGVSLVASPDEILVSVVKK